MGLLDFTGKFREIVNMSDTVRLFKIELDREISFKAGQFVNVSFEEDGERMMKSYSIASAPSLTNELELCIKLVENGRVTPKLFHKKEGDQVNIKGPLGMFTLDNSKKDKLVFIGTGTGIAPLRSMIFDLLEKNSSKEITLIFGCRFENEILFQKDFESLEEEHPNFRFIKIVSKPSDNWQGRTGHVQDNFDIIDIMNSEAYLCGLPLMVEGAVDKLKELGMNNEDIKHEKFH